MSIKKKGTQSAYRKRGVILRAIIEKLDPTKIHQTDRSINVDCVMNVCELADRLFLELPKGKFSLKCNRDCPRVEIEITYTFLPNALLHDSRSEESIYNHLKGPVKCTFCLHGIAEKSYEASGNYLTIIPFLLTLFHQILTFNVDFYNNVEIQNIKTSFSLLEIHHDES